MVLVGIIQSTPYLADVLFGLGMFGALNADSTQNKITELAESLLKSQVLMNNAVPQQVTHVLNTNKDSYAYYLISTFLMTAFTLNCLFNLTAYPEQKRNALFNLIITVYSLSTTFRTLHDILLNDEKKNMPLNEKRKHVLYPLNIYKHKQLSSENTPTKQVNGFIKANYAKLQKHASNLAVALSLIFGFYYTLPMATLFLWGFLFLYAQNSFNQSLDALLNLLSLKLVRNEFGGVFVDYQQMFSPKKVKPVGRQYSYFRANGKHIKKVTKKWGYDVLQKYEFGKNASTAGSFLMRGAIVASCLFNFDVIGMKGVYGIMSYYLVHAAIAFVVKDEDYFMDKPLKRVLAAIPESILAAYLFYKPIMQYNFPK